MHPDPWRHEAAEVAAALGTHPQEGLTRAEAARRLAVVGPNELPTARPESAWRRFLHQFRDPLVYLLGVAVVVSLVVWLVGGRDGWPVDALVIAVVLVLNAAIGFTQEQRAEQAVAALRRMTAPTATVVRDGEPHRVPARDLVPGDLLVLAEGDTVAADARLLEAAALAVSEAPLTGESEPVDKHPDLLAGRPPLAERRNMVHHGTAVMRGSGRAVVTATGIHTEVGRIAGLLQRTPQEPTPLQRQLGYLGRVLGIAVAVTAAVVTGTVLFTGRVGDLSDLLTVLLLGVALAVAAVPEGLPAILSVVLALGVRRMAAHRAVVKRLSSVETLGSATVICTDKTGTLTRGEMTLATVVTAGGRAQVTGVGYAPVGRVLHDGAELVAGPRYEDVRLVLAGGALAGEAQLRRDERGGWVVHGDPTDAAFVVAMRKLAGAADWASRFRRVGVAPFTSERRMMSTLQLDATGEATLFAKGAPDVLLRRCTRLHTDGGTVPMDDEHRRRLLSEVDRLTGRAYRTIAVAYRPMGRTAPPVVDERLEQDLVFAGVAGIIDPPRAEAATAVAEAHAAGVRVVMITGDHPRTAARIAADLGIAEPGRPVLTGDDLDRLSPTELVEAVDRTVVYARVTPEHKLTIVDALQARGHVVAMTGDGVNDAPALKSADIGIAMGITGTEVTRQAARMVLADDNFATIVRAVREGRHIFDNIRKFLRYLLSSNAGEVLTVFLGVVFAGALGLTRGDGGLVLPLLVTQILWINLLTDSGMALAMGVDPEIDDVMARPPRRLTDRVIDLRMWLGVLVTGLVMAAAALCAVDLFLPGGLVTAGGGGPAGDDLTLARTAGFTVLVLAQCVNSLNTRSETVSVFRRQPANRWLWAAIGAALVLQVAVVHLPPLQVAFGTTALSPTQWLVCALLAASVLAVGELRKLVQRTLDRRRARAGTPAGAGRRA